VVEGVVVMMEGDHLRGVDELGVACNVLREPSR
jgi:hypothetical protein